MSRITIVWKPTGILGTYRMLGCVALRAAPAAVSGGFQFFSKISSHALFKRADRLSAWPFISADIQASASRNGWIRFVPPNRIQLEWARCCAALPTSGLRTHCRGTALRLGLVLLMSFISAGHSFSDEKCEYPDAFGTLLVPAENRLGEFRIALQPPDYQSTTSVQQHLVFSTVLARLLSEGLAARTRGFCETVITPALFPDLRVYLIMNRSPGDGETDRSACTRPVQDIVLKFEPDTETINKSASAEANRILQRISNRGGELIVAYNILASALAYIYQPDTVLRALFSVNAAPYRSLDPSSFLDWLQAQRSGGRIELSPLLVCPPDTARQSLRASAAAEKLPNSGTITAGVVKLSMSGSQRALAPSLRHLVIVGHGGNPSAPVHAPATDKYCDREHVFVVDRNTDLIKGVRVRCLRTNLYSNLWTVFFCNPNDCTSDHTAKAVAEAIAKDPDVVTLASGNSAIDPPKGPYLIETTDE